MKQSHFGSVLARFASRCPGFVALVATCALVACGGGGGGGGGGSNRAPVASFTVSPASGTAPVTVTVDASASSDPDGSLSSYAWNFGDNTSGAGVLTTHTYTTGNDYTITLTVTDNKGKKATATHSVSIAAGPPPTSVTVGGRITYQRVPFNATLGLGLNYALTTAQPARGIVVELVKASDQSVLLATGTDASGNYQFNAAPVNTEVKVRAKAQSQSLGTALQPAKWDIRVRNNTNSDALYVMDGATFNTGIVNHTKNLLAKSGWPDFNGTSYTGTRVAAPFAILDTLYTAVQFVVTQGDDAAIALPALNVYWAPANQPSETFTPANGNIQSTQYLTGTGGGIYVLGKEDNDTDEYDDHVLTHEFQHYLQDATSRDDTVGGPHSFGENLDMRVAFSEGYANAFSAFSLDDAQYRDSSGDNQGSEMHFNLETDAAGTTGWFNESTIGAVAWDLFDAHPDAGDAVTLPYASIAAVFRNQLRTGPPLTSVFPFAVGLKSLPGAPVAGIDALLDAKGIAAADAFGSTETVDGSNPDALPIYSNVALNGAAVSVCGNRQEGLYNTLGNRRFLKFSVNSTVDATIHAVFTTTGSDPATVTTVAPDPDIVVFRSGFLAVSESAVVNQETMPITLDAGDYVIEVYEYSHIEAPATGTSRGRTCYKVTITG